MGLGPGKVRAIAPDVGGGFGAKGGYGCYPEDVVVAWVARHLDHPTRWCETRTEATLAMGHGRASTHTVKIGATRDGIVQAYSVTALQDSGVYPAMGTFITSNLKNSGTGTYDIAQAYVSGTSVVTNSNSTNAFRGAGRPEAACSIERAMDNLALAIGVSPVEIRRRNFVAPTAFLSTRLRSAPCTTAAIIAWPSTVVSRLRAEPHPGVLGNRRAVDAWLRRTKSVASVDRQKRLARPDVACRRLRKCESRWCEKTKLEDA